MNVLLVFSITLPTHDPRRVNNKTPWLLKRTSEGVIPVSCLHRVPTLPLTSYSRVWSHNILLCNQANVIIMFVGSCAEAALREP